MSLSAIITFFVHNYDRLFSLENYLRTTKIPKDDLIVEIVVIFVVDDDHLFEKFSYSCEVKNVVQIIRNTSRVSPNLRLNIKVSRKL